MSRGENQNSEEFSEYQKFIVTHQNYRSLPNKTNQLGEITWVKVKDSARAKWWDQLKINMSHNDRASVARSIHPVELGGYKPCQICGRKMSIHAVYPDANKTKKIATQFPDLNLLHFDLEISEVATRVQELYGSKGLKKLGEIFDLIGEFSSSDNLASDIIDLKKGLSPGVMSNAPDRLDGFHTYNACCRATKDSGRHFSNLSRYATDRRAYENWADGNWRGADRLMGKFQSSNEIADCPSCGCSTKMSADHIGPISLGFMHRMDFRPLCINCNSKKNNRMSLSDIQSLISKEKSGEEVISWHSKALWNRLKINIETEEQALQASKLLRKNMHYVMCILSTIYDSGFQSFLESYLHPEYAAYDYKFTYFDVGTGKFTAERYPVDSLNTRKQARRYIRISFESLREYAEKDNRNSARWVDHEVDLMIEETLKLIAWGSDASAKGLIGEILDRLATSLESNF
jgi:Alw26I/Eco31I/Esp3I family type II restriction endonuclease